MTTQLSNEDRQEWIDAMDGDLDSLLGDGNMPTAQEFIDAGVPLHQYHTWYEVGGWDIDSMKELENACDNDDYLSISDFGAKTDQGCTTYTASIAYKFCNGDLDLEQSIALAKGEELPE